MKNFIFCFLLWNLLFSTACVRIHMMINNLDEPMPISDYEFGYRSDKIIDQSQLDSLDPFSINGSSVLQLESLSCPVEGARAEALAQQTDTWCWAGSGATVMRFHGRNGLKQCKIVNDILRERVIEVGGVQTPFCCGDGTIFAGTGLQYPGQCWINGRPEWALESQNFDYRVVVGPLEEPKLASQLCKNGPIIFILLYRNSPGGHSLVAKEMVVDSVERKLSLWVHDHSWIGGELNEEKDRIPTEYELWPYELFEEGWWNGEQHHHDSDIVQIKPL